MLRLRKAAGHIKGFGISHFRHGLSFLAYRNLLPPGWSDRLISNFWEERALDIHARWGKGTDDYAALRRIIARYQWKSVLDVGCGSGRLFPLYRQCGVQYITGIDLSVTALALAHEAYPDVQLRQLRLEELDYPVASFDLGVCNRVLQHVPETHIGSGIQKLCDMCRYVYINELTDSDQLHQTFWMSMHDYRRLFQQSGFTCLESERIGPQTYYLFGRAS
jgi:SAM-dependent methyltransferase